MQICQNKNRTNFNSVSSKGSDKPHDDVDNKCTSKIHIMIYFHFTDDQIFECETVTLNRGSF